MSANIPQVSIIMATFNRAHLIKETLNSILAQSFKYWECLIIDDGSTDTTTEIIHKFINLDPRFKYFKRSKNYKKGLPGCRNMGLDLAEGNAIIFYDDDDIVHPKNLEVCTDLIINHKKQFVNYQKKTFYNELPDFQNIQNTKNHIKDFNIEDIEDFIIGNRAMASCTVLWDKSCFEIIRFDESLNYAEEWECYTRIFLNGFTGITIDKVLYYNRKHSNSNTGEFSKGSRIRINSLAKAAKIIIDNLSEHEKLNYKLENFFIRLSFQINNYTILKKIFNKTNPNVFKRLKYTLGFMFYPIIKPIFNVKGKLLKS